MEARGAVGAGAVVLDAGANVSVGRVVDGLAM